VPQVLLNQACRIDRRQNKTADKLTLDELDVYHQALHHSEPRDP
jgi:hypothetical protein